MNENSVLYPNNYFIYFLILLTWVLLELLIFYEIWDLASFIILFFVAFLFFILLIRNGVKLFQSRKRLDFKKRIFKFLFVLTILFLTIFKFNYIPQNLIERFDWILLYDKRVKIIEDIKLGKIKTNVYQNNSLYRLPYKYPIISNSGNEIVIEKDNKNFYTVDFFITRPIFISPAARIVFTESEDVSSEFEKKIKEDPTQNKKLEKNWYRISGD